MPAGRAIDELRGDADATTGLAHAPFEQVADLEVPRDLRCVDKLALEREGRVARGNPQRRNLAQVRDDVLGDAVGEVFLFGVAAHVGERQNADRYAARTSGLDLLALDTSGRMHGEHTHGTLDVLHGVLAEVLERTRSLAGNLVADRERNDDAADRRERLQTRSDIHALTVNVVTFDNDIAEIDADPVANARLFGTLGLGVSGGLLDRQRTVDSRDHAPVFIE